MLDSQEIIKELPAQRDDEPTSLRRDIADEILDHLHVAMRRELLVRGGDEDSAWNRVIDRFGDPRQVARRLWFQAMWSKIMTQRLVVISALVSMTLSVVLTAMVASMIHGQQQTNAALVDQMSKLVLQQKPTSTATPERDPRWNNLKIKVTLGSKTGPAAEGLNVTVSKLPEIGEVVAEESENSAVSKTKVTRQQHQATTDAQGFVDCGFVSPGLYQLDVKSLTSELFASTFTIFPGRDHVEEVVAPQNGPEMTDVSFHLEGLPEDLDSKKYGLILGFPALGARKIDGYSWEKSGWFPFDSMPFVLIVPGRGVWLTHISRDSYRYPETIFYPQKGKGAKWQRLEQPSRFQIPAYEYSVCFDFVRVPLEMTPDDPEWNRNVLYEPKDMMKITNGQMKELYVDGLISLVALTDQSNEWTIHLPNELLSAWERRAVASAPKNSSTPTPPIGSRGNRPPSIRRNGPGIPYTRTPRLVSDGRVYPDLAARLQLTSRQQSEINHLLPRRSELLKPFRGFGSDPNPESRAKLEEQLTELDQEALEILTIEQKQLWKDFRAELIQELIDGDLETLKSEESGTIAKLRQEVYFTRAKLTEEQTQKLNEVETQLDTERRKFVSMDGQELRDEQRKNWLREFEELDKQFAECLTEEQKAVLVPKTAPATRAPRS